MPVNQLLVQCCENAVMRSQLDGDTCQQFDISKRSGGFVITWHFWCIAPALVVYSDCCNDRDLNLVEHVGHMIESWALMRVQQLAEHY